MLSKKSNRALTLLHIYSTNHLASFVVHLPYFSPSRGFRYSVLLGEKAAQSIHTMLYFWSGFIIYCVGKYNKTRSTSQPIPRLFIAFFVICVHITAEQQEQHFEARFPSAFNAGCLETT